jgi:hypothetical protein
MQNHIVVEMQELLVAEVELVSGGLFDAWWASNRGVSLANGGSISRDEMMTAA